MHFVTKFFKFHNIVNENVNSGNIKSSYAEVFFSTGFLEKFTKFTELEWSPLFSKVADVEREILESFLEQLFFVTTVDDRNFWNIWFTQCRAPTNI